MIKILAIDDVKNNITVVKTLLEHHFDDCEVISAGSGTEGVEMAIKERPQLVLLNIDISAGDSLDGYEICRILKGNPATSEISIILLIDMKNETVSYDRGLALGANAFLSLPIIKAELIAMVNVVLRMKKSEDILRNSPDSISEELSPLKNGYEELFNSVIDGLFLCNSKGKIIDVNRRGTEYFDLPKGAILNLKFFDYIEGDEIEKFIKGADSGTIRVETDFILPTGAFPVEINGSLITYMERPAFLAVVRDISARKAEEQGRNDELKFLERLLNSFGSAIIVVDAGGVIRSCNSSGALFLGRDREAIIGESLTHLAADFEIYLKLYENRGEDERPLYLHRQRFKLAHLAGNSYDIFISPFGTNAEQSYTVFKIDDNSNYNKLEGSTVQELMMQSYSHFSRGLAHDLNNILTGINTVVSLMRLDMERGGEINMNEYLGTIEVSGSRATDIVKQLRSIARRDKLSLARVELNRSIDNVVKICNNSFDASVSIKVNLSVDNPLIEAELTGIEQVIFNICLNSAHAMTIMREEGERQGGIITIKTGRFYADRYYCLNHPGVEEKEYIKLSIVDTGVGVDSEQIQKIFEPFYSTKDKGIGKGMGLSVAYNIVKQHKGFIEFDSKKGEGTVVNIYLPEYKDAAGKAGRKDGAATLATGEGSVLVVDSEELVRKLAASILKKCGYTVFSTDTGSEALEIIEREQIKLVLLDVSINDPASDDIVTRIKGGPKDVKVLLSSGFIRDDRINSYMEQGCDGFLEKPFNVRQLSNIVKETLEKD